eukprot:7376493-Prymnesium_polylepis.1
MVLRASSTWAGPSVRQTTREEVRCLIWSIPGGTLGCLWGEAMRVLQGPRPSGHARCHIWSM